jgi:hypothetical protein
MQSKGKVTIDAHSLSFVWPLQVHCQGGKGRSGTFCSSLLLWTGFCSTAAESLHAFVQRRTDERIKSTQYQGVTGPSQLRYVNYIEGIVNGVIEYIAPPRTLITSVKLRTLPLYQKGSTRVSFIIESLGTIQFDHGKRHGLTELTRSSEVLPEEDEYMFDTDDTLVAGDVCIRFFHFEDSSPGQMHECDKGPGARTLKYDAITGKELCFVTFHTSFHSSSGSIVFERSDIDGVHDQSIEDYLSEFSITVICETAIARSKCRSLGRKRSMSATPASFPSLAESQNVLNMNLLDTSCTNSIKNVSSRAHSLSVHSESDIGNIPYGTAPGLRLLRLLEVFTGIVGGPSSVVLSFKGGQLMYDPSDHTEGYRCLYMIVSGNAEYDQGDCEERRLPSRINRGDSISGLPLGPGQCYGELAFLLGHDGDLGSFRIRASSQMVQVLVAIRCIQNVCPCIYCLDVGINYAHIGLHTVLAHSFSLF